MIRVWQNLDELKMNMSFFQRYWGILLIAFMTFMGWSVQTLAQSPAPATTSALGPGWFSVSGETVNLSQSQAYSQARASLPLMQSLQSTKQAIQVLSPSSLVSPQTETEIAELARGLVAGGDITSGLSESSQIALRIYEYVLNHIDYTPYYGFFKGPVVTLLDRAGNDFDQASLLVSLYRAAGFEAQYVHGAFVIPNSGGIGDRDMAHWLGVDAAEVLSVLGDGGIPVLPYNGGNSTKMERVWVRMSLPTGETYDLDPAFKVYDTDTGIDVGAAMSFDENALLGAAGGISTTDSIKQIDYTSLSTELANLTTNLTTHLTSANPNASVDEVIRGRRIRQQTLSALPTTLGFPHGLVPSNPVWVEIPNQYHHLFTVDYGDIHYVMPTADIAGKKLALIYEANASGTVLAKLTLDDVVVAEETAPTGSTLTLGIDHVYASNNGTYGDQTVSTTTVRQLGNAYVVILGFGHSESGQLLERRQRYLESLLASGKTGADLELLTESLNLLGQTWMRQSGLMTRILGELSGYQYEYIHRFGIAVQEEGYFIDVAGQLISSHPRLGTSTAQTSFFGRLLF